MEAYRWNHQALMDILEHHEQEEAALRRQLYYLGKRLREDLEELRARVLPGGVRYDSPRVQSSPGEEDPLVEMIQTSDQRREGYRQNVWMIQKRLDRFREVYAAIHRLDGSDKVVLLELYYPRQSAEKAAERLGMESRTVCRHRDRAVRKLLGLLSGSV